MNYGLYLSAAGVMTSMHRQDVLANNLANVNTPGFKPDDLTLRARLPERLESVSFAALVDPQYLLEQLGGGTLAEPTRMSFRQGDLSHTKNDLDVAIEGEGFFIVHSGRVAGDPMRLTRDGRFTRNSGGELVMAATGMRVMDVNDRPIRLNPAGAVRIDVDGTVKQDEQVVAKLQVATISDKSQITKEGANLMRLAAGAKRQAAAGVVRQGYIESSGVDPIAAMNKMINASKAVSANVTMMQYHDHILGQAVNTFGRVA